MPVRSIQVLDRFIPQRTATGTNPDNLLAAFLALDGLGKAIALETIAEVIEPLAMQLVGAFGALRPEVLDMLGQ